MSVSWTPDLIPLTDTAQCGNTVPILQGNERLRSAGTCIGLSVGAAEGLCQYVILFAESSLG